MVIFVWLKVTFSPWSVPLTTPFTGSYYDKTDMAGRQEEFKPGGDGLAERLTSLPA